MTEKKVQTKKVIIKVDDKFLKVPMAYLTLDVPDEELDEDDGTGSETLKIRGSISSLGFSGGFGIIHASIPNIHAEMKLSRSLTGLDLEYGHETERAYKAVCDTYLRLHKKLKIVSRVGVQMKVKYDTDTMKIVGDEVQMRSAVDNRELLIPNIYTMTGKICWGRGNTVPDFEKPEHMAGGLMTAFLTAPFNNDLSGKELRAFQYVKYLQICSNRINGLNWTQSGKNNLKTWLNGEIRWVHNKVVDVTVRSVVTRNAYILLLLASIFEDDICELAGFLHNKQLNF